MSLNPEAIIAVAVYTLLHACIYAWSRTRRVQNSYRLEAAGGNASCAQLNAPATTTDAGANNHHGQCRRVASSIHLAQTRQRMAARFALSLGVLVMGCVVIASLAS
ncbi:MAG: hypothetical protein H6985_10520 [Pseudomonadales bacterium]|nr:hypothetical protein [Pseudomonadales bacterium]